MLGKPGAGWSRIKIKDVDCGSASYITPLPIECLESLIKSKETGLFCVSCDAEGYHFYVMADTRKVYAILFDESNEGQSLKVFDDINIQTMAKEISNDISSNIDAWATWDEFDMDEDGNVPAEIASKDKKILENLLEEVDKIYGKPSLPQPKDIGKIGFDALKEIVYALDNYVPFFIEVKEDGNLYKIFVAEYDTYFIKDDGEKDAMYICDGLSLQEVAQQLYMDIMDNLNKVAEQRAADNNDSFDEAKDKVLMLLGMLQKLLMEKFRETPKYINNEGKTLFETLKMDFEENIE
jgi:hypothetical protein